jgi:hypothetical protein
LPDEPRAGRKGGRPLLFLILLTAAGFRVMAFPRVPIRLIHPFGPMAKCGFDFVFGKNPNAVGLQQRRRHTAARAQSA